MPVIVIVDAEADPDYTFEGLSNLVRKARLDFGAEIRFLTETELNERVALDVQNNFGTLEQLRRGIWVEEPIDDPAVPVPAPPAAEGPPRPRRRSIRPATSAALSIAHAALAEITYADDRTRTSMLLYIKPTLIGDESADVRRYHSEHASFLHEPTLQQFFNEDQWESYRKLGEHIATKLFREPAPPLGGWLPYDWLLTGRAPSPPSV